jgi:orotate phosphoribosyltransferase-like protein
VVIVDQAELPVYLKIADKAKHLRELGMSDRAIASALCVSDKTVAKAIVTQAALHSGRT